MVVDFPWSMAHISCCRMVDLLRLLAMVNMIYSIHLSHLYSIMFSVFTPCFFAWYWNAVKNNPIIVLFNYVSVFITCLFAWYWWHCEKEYNHCSLQLWRNCYNRNNGTDARERNCEMLIAFIVFEVFDIWMVYVGQETEKCQLISVSVLISKLRHWITLRYTPCIRKNRVWYIRVLLYMCF